MAPSRNSPRRFEPEIYMAKAEQDIRRVQIACSLVEPPWDGFCGLVQVSEEETQPAEECLDSPRQVWSDASSSVAQEPAVWLGGTSPFNASIHGSGNIGGNTDSIAVTHTASPSGRVTDGRGRQDQTLHSIMQQIKEIAGTSTAQRSARLQSLARQALHAAAQNDQPTALQLLKLADYACPASETELKQEIQRAMSRCSIALHAGRLGESLATNGSQTRQLKGGAGQQAAPDQSINEDPEAPTAASSFEAAHEEQYGAAAANKHFLTATSMIKRNMLVEALEQLNLAFQKCPPDKTSARAQIQRHRAAVTAALKQQGVARRMPT